MQLLEKIDTGEQRLPAVPVDWKGAGFFEMAFPAIEQDRFFKDGRSHAH